MNSTGIPILHGLVIPEHEIIVSTSRSSGAGGQHVNKTDTRITLTWYVEKSNVFSDVQKKRILEKLHNDINQDGALIIHSDTSRSQLQNKKDAYKKLSNKLRLALREPKKRIKTVISHKAHERRLHKKKLHGQLKKERSQRFNID